MPPRIEDGGADQVKVAVPFAHRLLLDPKAAAEMLSVSEGTLEKLPIPRTKIPGIRRVYYKRADLEEYARNL